MNSGLFRKELFDGWQPTLKTYRPTEESDLRNVLNSNKANSGASVFNFNKASGSSPTGPVQTPPAPPINPWGLQPGQSPWQNPNIWQTGPSQYQNQSGWQGNRGRGRGRGRGRPNSTRNFGPNY